jgi:hypothetical protein
MDTTKMEEPCLQFQEEWLRLKITISYPMSTTSKDYQNVETFKNFLSDTVKERCTGLIGWYGWRNGNSRESSEPGIVYTIILRFLTDKMRGDVFTKAEETISRKISGTVEITGSGNASIDLLPGPIESYKDRKAFGILPPELSCFYDTGHGSCCWKLAVE